MTMFFVLAVGLMGCERKRSMTTTAHAPGPPVSMKLGARISRRLQPPRTTSCTAATPRVQKSRMSDMDAESAAACAVRPGMNSKTRTQASSPHGVTSSKGPKSTGSRDPG
ncbi:hypothetical protein B0H12DRAFT_1135331, partial [Mycena haematopus]